MMNQPANAHILRHLQAKDARLLGRLDPSDECAQSHAAFLVVRLAVVTVALARGCSRDAAVEELSRHFPSCGTVILDSVARDIDQLWS